MLDGGNIWVLKPNDANRGRGVHIFNKLDELRSLIFENIQNDTTYIRSPTTDTQSISPPVTAGGFGGQAPQ